MNLIPINENNSIDSNMFPIPADVLSLMWIGNGPMKNISRKPDNKDGFVKFYIRPSEPSAIDLRLPISVCDLTKATESIGYYPSYEGLTPEQRYIYLKWLCDFSLPVDIGYVFIYYYGLERHLAMGKQEDAIKMIQRLRSLYKDNSSFDTYSGFALACTAVKKKDLNLLLWLINSVEFDKTVLREELIKFKAMIMYRIDANDLKLIDRFLNADAKKYARRLKDNFSLIFTDYLLTNFGKTYVDITEEEIKNSRKAEDIIYANFSLPDRDGFESYDIKKNEKLMERISAMIIDCYTKYKESKKKKK